MHLRKLNRDKTIVSLSYARLLEALVNAFKALKPAWNQLGCDGER